MVVLGSPHFSLAEFAQLTPLVDGRNRQQTFAVQTQELARELSPANRSVLRSYTCLNSSSNLSHIVLRQSMTPARWIERP